MIYKVITDFGENLEIILKHFQNDYNIMFYKNVIYLADKEAIETKKEVFVLKENFFKSLAKIDDNQAFIVAASLYAIYD